MRFLPSRAGLVATYLETPSPVTMGRTSILPSMGVGDRKAKQPKAACKAARAPTLRLTVQPEILAAFQAAWMIWAPLTQGIGLRPQPWARVSRPVGPVLPGALSPRAGWR